MDSLERAIPYACSWCELKRNQLTLVPHPLSRSRLRHFAYMQEAEIIGRVGLTGEFSVNGQRQESNNYTVDGVSANL